jgi:hypothetical protein
VIADDVTIDRSADPYAILLHARSAVSSAAYPRRIDYTIAVRGLDGTTPKANHYRAIADPNGGQIRIFSISDEELAAPPPVPHGFNFGLSASVCGGNCGTGSGTLTVPVGHDAVSPDLLGVPMIAPTYSFGLKYPHAPKLEPDSDEKTSLPVIAFESTKVRDYTVTLVDTPAIDGVPTYHLRLAPLRKPKDNRLRELWIGTQDYLPRKAVVAGNFTTAPLVDVPWTIRFTIVNGAPYVAGETADATLFLAHRRVVRNAEIEFEHIHESDGTIVHEPLVTPEISPETLVEP